MFLDTAHALPGELLQFLAIYPFLAKGATVAMHDISLNGPRKDPRVRSYAKAAYATKILFSVAGSSEKMMPAVKMPNIGAFINDDLTADSIFSLFFALGVTWQYYPAGLINKYAGFFKKYYGEFYSDVFLNIAANQEAILNQK